MILNQHTVNSSCMHLIRRALGCGQIEWVSEWFDSNIDFQSVQISILNELHSLHDTVIRLLRMASLVFSSIRCVIASNCALILTSMSQCKLLCVRESCVLVDTVSFFFIDSSEATEKKTFPVLVSVQYSYRLNCAFFSFVRSFISCSFQ